MNKKQIFSFIVLLGITAIITGFLVRYAIAFSQVNEAQTVKFEEKWTDFGSTTTLNVLPVYEDWSKDNQLISGPGLAYLIKTDSTTIMFDLGNNPDQADPSPLTQNMSSLGITFDDIDAVVLSHNHPDHVGGFAWWRQRSFSADSQQRALRSMPVYLPEDMKHPEVDTMVVTQPVLIAPGLVSIGTLPFIEPFPLSILEPLGREQVLAINVEGRGIVLISGCGHPGLEAIVNRAESLFNEPVIGVIGGLHFLKTDEVDLAPHIDILKQRNPVLIALSPHDSSGSVLQAFESAFPEVYRYIVAGHEISLS